MIIGDITNKELVKKAFAGIHTVIAVIGGYTLSEVWHLDLDRSIIWI